VSNLKVEFTYSTIPHKHRSEKEGSQGGLKMTKEEAQRPVGVKKEGAHGRLRVKKDRAQSEA
jgi:hypothetical protein